MSKILYSLCICNYNMNDTLESCINSLLCQINDQTEIVIIDDGSDDKSIETLTRIKKDNIKNNFRFIPLLRDRRRKLGETRNVAIRAAKGKYVLLHIDTDDVWGNYINSFISVYHELEKRLDEKDFMLSGNQIQMATKELVTKNPYENVYYGEDRLLWSKLATLGKLISLDHKSFRQRIPLKNFKKKIIKVLRSQFSAMCISFAYSPSIFQTLNGYLKKIFFKSDWNYKISIYNSLILIPAFINGTLISRQKLHNLATWEYRNLTKIDLKNVEEMTKEKHGEFNLTEKERDIYFSF